MLKGGGEKYLAIFPKSCQIFVSPPFQHAKKDVAVFAKSILSHFLFDFDCGKVGFFRVEKRQGILGEIQDSIRGFGKGIWDT